MNRSSPIRFGSTMALTAGTSHTGLKQWRSQTAVVTSRRALLFHLQRPLSLLPCRRLAVVPIRTAPPLSVIVHAPQSHQHHHKHLLTWQQQPLSCTANRKRYTGTLNVRFLRTPRRLRAQSLKISLLLFDSLEQPRSKSLMLQLEINQSMLLVLSCSIWTLPTPSSTVKERMPRSSLQLMRISLMIAIV